ncbi:MAG: hydantoinase/oxoprolinase family protein [Deltaproteobacteria bacterium]|nr:MAG: hydantoinase/oxoprolinase family protein [Deltaproteobacteria bacterium]
MSTRNDSQKALVLGIDTGGTYTDGILLEYHSRKVLASHKSLTTKRDFSIGIEAVIQGIRIEDPSAIQMVSISTTLATNAIAEGKSKRVALFLIGYDPELISSFNMQGRFATPHYHYFSGGHDLYGQEKEPLDLPAILAKVSEIKNDVDAIAVSGYFRPLNPEHENRSYTAISSVCDLPVVLGHQLSTKLGSVERATTAALNASLLAVLKDFVVAVRRALERRQIDAPLMVVRGDGTLMSDEFATRTPVETIHSGPAASAIGGRFLSHLDDALVVDIGGTTTDFALIENGQVTVSEEGATVADYKTAVEAANLFSIGLGGDSHIALNRENKVTIGPRRVVPLAYLADQYPQVQSQLHALSQRSRTNATPDWLEYWYLLRDPQDNSLLETDHEKALIEFLADGPKPLPEILKRLDLFHKVQIGAGNLLRQEIIGKSGLTPTDLLHVEGRYASWDTESASLALNVFCRFQLRDPDELRQQVWLQMTEAIVHAIVTFLSGKKLELSTVLEDDDIGRWFFYNSLYANHPHLETRFRLRQPIIGIGAPAGIFLKDVADVLHTELILPKHHQVANAVGAVAGSVMVTEEILVYPRVSSDGFEVTGYYVQTKDERQLFEAASDALEQARALSRERALGAALRSGADHPQILMKEQADGLDTYRIQAKAVGNPRLTH